MKHTTFAWLAVLIAVAGAVDNWNPWSEENYVPFGLARFGSQDQVFKSQDFMKYGGATGQQSLWAGQNVLSGSAQQQNAQQQKEKSQASDQKFGLNGESFNNAAKLIADEARRNQKALNEDERSKYTDYKAAAGGDATKANQWGFNTGDKLQENINGAYKKKYDTSSSENGGYETEDARVNRRTDTVKTKEKDYILDRKDASASHAQKSEEQAAKEAVSKSDAAQKQAQDGKYGFNDRSLDQAGKTSDGRLIDYARKDSRYLDEEAGKDQAVRLAKDIAEHAAGYEKDAAVSADANRNAADNKFYGGGAGVGSYSAWPGEAAGGVYGSGFKENAAQHQKAGEQALDKALSSSDALNEYNRNKAKQDYNEIKGLKDYNEGGFAQDVKDASGNGYAGKNAEAVKHVYDLDQKNQAAKSASAVADSQKSNSEYLKDRELDSLKESVDSETVTQKKNFYNNKKEAGNTDEILKFDHVKNAAQFGNAQDGSTASQNKYDYLKDDSKAAAKSLKLDDYADSRNSGQKENAAKTLYANGFEQQKAQDSARALSASDGSDKAAYQAYKDDSQSGSYGKYQNLNDKASADHLSQEIKPVAVSYPSSSGNYGNGDDLWRGTNSYKPSYNPAPPVFSGYPSATLQKTFGSYPSSASQLSSSYPLPASKAYPSSYSYPSPAQNPTYSPLPSSKTASGYPSFSSGWPSLGLQLPFNGGAGLNYPGGAGYNYPGALASSSAGKVGGSYLSNSYSAYGNGNKLY
ncbi:LOW QUALITY PROTEIN: uncharacterized protein LOC112560630 [Pomacea canaliculata]|uniref:LOW QUALITY PROTEIN: uncharacterized protein LOC112560630 n=1 Tax=Pomacea canaliculata TaxID=400727 RepID=UPI000D737E0F|nr:LOW QUALITY PROTEIN: uncharacterized protein LOC112560630 [Pomacea canaliculata]